MRRTDSVDLNEAINEVLKIAGRPLSPNEIASRVNYKNYFDAENDLEIDSDKVIQKVIEFPDQFQTINGLIIQINNAHWKSLITGYWHVTSLLKEAYKASDVQFIIAVIFFIKRKYDITGNSYVGDLLNWYQEYRTASDKMLATESSWIDSLRKLENYDFGPKGVFEGCYILLSRLNHKTLREILSIINQIDTSSYLDKEFGRIFEHLIGLSSTDGNKATIYQTPYSVRQLMVRLLNPLPYRSVYDPVAGSGGLLIECNLYTTDLIAKGTEIDTSLSQVANINAEIYGLPNVSFMNENCLHQASNSDKYDYIIADLPLNGVSNSYDRDEIYYFFNLGSPKSKRDIGAMVLYVYLKLNSTGRGVITVPEGFLSAAGAEMQVRRLLVEHDVIDSIISLPIGSLKPYTNAKASLIILDKRKPENLRNKIRFINAVAIRQDSKSLTIDISELVNRHENNSIFSKDVKLIEASDLQSNTNLSTNAYDAPRILATHMLKEGSGKVLSDLVEIRSGVQPEKTGVSTGLVPFIKIENLSRDILDTTLLKDKANRVPIDDRYKRSYIDVKCILIARIGENLKATIFNPENQDDKILIHTGVYALIPKRNSNEIDVEYLYYQLYTAFVTDQIKRAQLGAVMPYISIKSLKNIIVPFVDKNSQGKFVESQKANLIAEERNRAEERLKALGYIEEVKQSETDIIKILTHQLRPILLTINNLTNRVDRIVEREGIKDEKEYEDDHLAQLVDPEIAEFIQIPENYSLRELINNLTHDSKHLSDILSNVDKVMNFKLTASDLKEIDVLDFLDSYKQQKEVEINNRFSISVKGDHANALIDKASFKELFDQLLLNAENHGFKNMLDGRTNGVRFRIKYNKQRKVIAIEYSNNGEPYKLSEKDFISPFEKSKNSSGSGIGGNYIYRIIQAHGGEITVKENNQKGFSLTIELPAKIGDYE